MIYFTHLYRGSYNEENNSYDNNTGELTEEQQKEIFNKHIKDSLYD